MQAIGEFFEWLSTRAMRLAAGTPAFTIALLFVISWAASGPLFGFSEGWQLVINTSTTIVTFLMTFLIQRAQGKDTLATHLKLDELIAAAKGASARMINVEDLSEEQLKKLRDAYEQLRQKRDAAEHTIDEVMDPED